MEMKAFDRAGFEKDLARAKLESMKAARDLRELANLWSEFLTCSQRWFSKLRKGDRKGDVAGLVRPVSAAEEVR